MRSSQRESRGGPSLDPYLQSLKDWRAKRRDRSLRVRVHQGSSYPVHFSLSMRVTPHHLQAFLVGQSLQCLPPVQKSKTTLSHGHPWFPAHILDWFLDHHLVIKRPHLQRVSLYSDLSGLEPSCRVLVQTSNSSLIHGHLWFPAHSLVWFLDLHLVRKRLHLQRIHCLTTLQTVKVTLTHTRPMFRAHSRATGAAS